MTEVFFVFNHKLIKAKQLLLFFLMNMLVVLCDLLEKNKINLNKSILMLKKQ